MPRPLSEVHALQLCRAMQRQANQQKKQKLSGDLCWFEMAFEDALLGKTPLFDGVELPEPKLRDETLDLLVCRALRSRE